MIVPVLASKLPRSLSPHSPPQTAIPGYRSCPYSSRSRKRSIAYRLRPFPRDTRRAHAYWYRVAQLDWRRSDGHSRTSRSARTFWQLGGTGGDHASQRQAGACRDDLAGQHTGIHTQDGRQFLAHREGFPSAAIRRCLVVDELVFHGDAGRLVRGARGELALRCTRAAGY